jgi:drug/metabolite transporter (DMT)-like permease
MQKPYFQMFGYVFLLLGLMLLVLHGLDANSHLSIPGLIIVLLGLTSFALSSAKKK